VYLLASALRNNRAAGAYMAEGLLAVIDSAISGTVAGDFEDPDTTSVYKVHDGVLQLGGTLLVQRSKLVDHGRAAIVIRESTHVGIKHSLGTGGRYGLAQSGGKLAVITASILQGSDGNISGVKLAIPPPPGVIEVDVPKD